MSNRPLRSLFAIAAGAFALAGGHLAHAGSPATAFAVEFVDCVESIGVGLAPTANVLALTPPPFVPVGLGAPVSPIVVRTADCAGIGVNGSKPKPGSVVQIGAIIVPPQPDGEDIDNYTFWYYTTDAKLAHRLQDLGVVAQHVANLRYDLDPEAPHALRVTVRRPGDPRFALAGVVTPSVVPSGSFVSSWWQKGAAGIVRLDTRVPVIAIGSADLLLATEAGNALGALIGADTLAFPLVQQFNLFVAAHMRAAAVP